MRRFRTRRLQIPKKSVPLQRVFHSIRFKVNKVGVQRYSFFFAHTLILRQPYVNPTPILRQLYTSLMSTLRYLSATSPLTFRQPSNPVLLLTLLPDTPFLSSLPFHFLLTPPFFPFSPPVPLAFPASKTGNPSPFSAPVSRAWISSRNITVILLIYNRLPMCRVTYEKKNVTSLRKM